MEGGCVVTARGRAGRRAAVLLAVMLVITIAALVGSSVIYIADAQRGSTSNSLNQSQLRAIAWSGVQAVMAELGSQRETLLLGESPRLTGEWTLIEGSLVGTVRLAPTAFNGETAASEAARLDLNLATAPMLAKLPGLNADLAANIVSGRMFGSTEELTGVAGLPASALFDAEADRSGESLATPGLLTLTTVFTFDPNLAPDGATKVNLSAGWSDEVKSELAGRFPDAAPELEALFGKGGSFAQEADLIAALRRAQVPAARWDELLAFVTTSDEEYVRGRVDINAATVEVLGAIPGIDRPAAEKIVNGRSRMSVEDRRKVTWPLTQGLLSPEQFQQSAGWVTTRSLQWRVRVEGRLAPAREAEKTLGSTLRSDSESADLPGIVWEAVIDVSEPRPRVAYLRDVTHLPALVRQALAGEQEAPVEANPPDSLAGAVSDVATEKPNAGLKSNADLKLGTMKRQVMDLRSGLDLGTRKGGTRSEEAASPSEGTESAGSGADSGSGGGSPPPAPRDRRIGRWRGTN